VGGEVHFHCRRTPDLKFRLPRFASLELIFAGIEIEDLAFSSASRPGPVTKSSNRVKFYRRTVRKYVMKLRGKGQLALENKKRIRHGFASLLWPPRGEFTLRPPVELGPSRD